MARPQGNFNQAMRYLYRRWYDPTLVNVLHDMNNNQSLTFADATDSFSIFALSADPDSRVHLDRAAQNGARQNQQFFLNAVGALTTQTFYIATATIAITAIEEIHAIAETAAGTATAVVTHDTAGQAPGTGTVVMTNTFNLKGTANTVQSASLLAVDGLGKINTGIVLAPGDRLTLKTGGTATITALGGVVLTVFTAPGSKEIVYGYNQTTASPATQSFGLANRDLVVNAVWMVWSVAGTDAGTVTIDVTIEPSTTAPGAGTSVLAAAQNVKLSANTPVLVPLSATAANRLMRSGNRLSIKTNGTLTALAGLNVVVSVGPVGGFAYLGENEATFTLLANGTQATQGFFIADRDYEVIDFAEVHSTAGTDAGAVTLDCTIDKGVTAPGTGSSILASTVNLKGTANTVNVGVMNVSRRQRMISQGDLVSVKLTGVLTALAGVTATLSIAPR